MPNPRTFVLALVAIPAIRAVALAQAAPGTYDVLREEQVMVPMRDGVRLSTDLYRPARGGQAVAGQFPVLLLRTPYDKGDSAIVRQAHVFAAHGYVVALQNIRGRYRSEGVFTKYSVLDAPDGYDAIEWMGTQSWSNGRVGTWGAPTQPHAGRCCQLNPPHLRTMVINQGGMSNAWDHAVRHGGAFELGRELTWALQESRRATADPVARRALEQVKVEDWYAALPMRRGTGPLRVVPEYEAPSRRADVADYGLLQRIKQLKEHYAGL
jgi:putative CocE/NonD family hydrolase